MPVAWLFVAPMPICACETSVTSLQHFVVDQLVVEAVGCGGVVGAGCWPYWSDLQLAVRSPLDFLVA